MIKPIKNNIVWLALLGLGIVVWMVVTLSWTSSMKDATFPDEGPFLVPQTPQWVEALKSNANRNITLLTADENPLVQLMVHNGWAYASWETARLTGKSEPGAVLIHIDSHYDNKDLQGVLPQPSKLSEAKPIEYNIERFIPPAVYYGLIDEIYFVRNRKFITKENYEPHSEIQWIAQFKDNHGMTATAWIDHQGDDRPSIEKVKGTLVTEQSLGYSAEDIQVLDVRGPIRLHFDVAADQLPDFHGENRSMILDLDEDYFALTDAITDDEYISDAPRLKQEVEKDVRFVLEQLARKHARFDVITICLSAEYTYAHLIPQVTDKLVHYLEVSGLAQFLRSEEGAIRTKDFVRVPVDKPLLVQARNHFQNGRYQEAFRLARDVIKENKDEAKRQQQYRRIESPLVDRRVVDACCWWNHIQPSPVFTLGQKELNAVAEAHYLRSLILWRQSRGEEAAEELLNIFRHYDNAYFILSEYKPKGWTLSFRVPATGSPLKGSGTGFISDQWIQAKYIAYEQLVKMYAARLLENDSYQDPRFYAILAGNVRQEDRIKETLQQISQQGWQGFNEYFKSLQVRLSSREMDELTIFSALEKLVQEEFHIE